MREPPARARGPTTFAATRTTSPRGGDDQCRDDRLLEDTQGVASSIQAQRPTMIPNGTPTMPAIDGDRRRLPQRRSHDLPRSHPHRLEHRHVAASPPDGEHHGVDDGRGDEEDEQRREHHGRGSQRLQRRDVGRFGASRLGCALDALGQRLRHDLRRARPGSGPCARRARAPAHSCPAPVSASNASGAISAPSPETGLVGSLVSGDGGQHRGPDDPHGRALRSDRHGLADGGVQRVRSSTHPGRSRVTLEALDRSGSPADTGRVPGFIATAGMVWPPMRRSLTEISVQPSTRGFAASA